MMHGQNHIKNEIMNRPKIIIRYLPTRMQVKVKQSHCSSVKTLRALGLYGFQNF